MSRTRKGSKGPGYEYWGRRPKTDWFLGRYAKTLTHRAERRIAASEAQKAVKEEA